MSENVVFLLIGFIAGALTGGYLGMKKAENEFEGRIEALQKQHGEDIEERRKTAEKSLQKRSEALGEDKPIDFVKLSQTYKSAEFDARFAEQMHPEDDVESDDSDDNKGDDDEMDADDIYLINEGEFYHDVQFKKNGRLRYYQEDGVLTDHEGNPIQNQVDVIGVECMEAICDTELDYLYVANDILETVYEINIDHNKSYYSDIMGV